MANDDVGAGSEAETVERSSGSSCNGAVTTDRTEPFDATEPRPPRRKPLPWLVAISVVAIVSIAAASFVIGRVTAPSTTALGNQVAGQVRADLADDAVSDAGGARGLHIGYAGVQADSGDNALKSMFQIALKPTTGTPAWAGWLYVNRGKHPLTFVNSPDGAGSQMGQTYVLAAPDRELIGVNDEFVENPKRRLEISGERVTIEPGHYFQVVLIADGDENAGTAGGSFGSSTLELPLDTGNGLAPTISLVLPEPVEVDQPE